MGTSASGSGAGGSNPLIPSWIGGSDLPEPPQTPRQEPDQPVSNPNAPPDGQENNNSGENEAQPITNNNDAAPINNGSQQHFNDQAPSTGGGNRYTGPRRQFNNFIRSNGNDTNALKNALKGYSRHAAGSTRQMARRMSPSASRVAVFFDAINTVRSQGTIQAFRQFNIVNYQDRPLLDVLSALTDVVFGISGAAYENTQDDSITKHAYANTIVRICEMDNIDLNSLTNEQVEVMTAIFMEETIAQRVINDIGNDMTKNLNNISELVEMENKIYQIVSGLIRNSIMPEIIATQQGNRANIDNKLENIYRIAFDAMAQQNN